MAWNTESMNCWNRSIRRFFFGFGSGGLSGGRRGSRSDWKVNGGVVVILLMEELLSAEATEERSISMLLMDDPRLVVTEKELSVSSVVQGVLIEFVLRCIRCVRS